MDKPHIISTQQALLDARKKSVALMADIRHRLEIVDTVNGVEWINDSKSTDLDSTYYSLELMEKPVVWIVGSSDIEADYRIFEKMAKYKVKKIICFGAYETQIKYTLASFVDGYAHKSNLAEAVITAKEWSKTDDVVLFSPACSSFDLYDNYRDRGEHFAHLVKALNA